MNSTEILVRLFSVFLLIALNAFFVAAEFSIVAVRRSRISQLVKAGDASAQTVQSLQKSIDRLLSTTQLGITLSSLALGWIGEKTMAVFVIRLISLSPLPPEVVKTVSHSLAIPVAFLLLAYWQIVLGELVPKSIALSYAEPLAKFFGPASLTISKVFNPIIWVLNQSTKILLSLVGIKYTTELFYNRVSPEELQTIISDQESTGLEAEERALLSQVFEFGEVAAQEVMIPRINMKVIPRDSTFKTLINLVANHGYSRLPVIGESADDIVGMIDFESLALSLATGKIKLEDKIEPWIQPIQFAPETTPLPDLLQQMQKSNIKMMMIVDEFGGIAGLVTFNDLIREIIGDRRQAKVFPHQPEWEIIDENTFLVSALMSIEEVNEKFNLNLPTNEDYYTLAGFILEKFQKIPQVGESIRHENLQFTVVEAKGTKLYKIKIHRFPASPLVSANSKKKKIEQ